MMKGFEPNQREKLMGWGGGKKCSAYLAERVEQMQDVAVLSWSQVNGVEVKG